MELDLRVPNPSAMYKLLIGCVVPRPIAWVSSATGRIDMRRLRPVGRLAGHQSTRVHEIFEMKRPAAEYRG